MWFRSVDEYIDAVIDRAKDRMTARAMSNVQILDIAITDNTEKIEL